MKRRMAEKGKGITFHTLHPSQNSNSCEEIKESEGESCKGKREKERERIDKGDGGS